MCISRHLGSRETILGHVERDLLARLQIVELDQLVVEDVVAWWVGMKETYPVLARMAFDVLAIPPMSDECERVFSQAKLVMGGQRSSLKPSTMEAWQCLKNWQKHGFL